MCGGYKEQGKIKRFKALKKHFDTDIPKLKKSSLSEEFDGFSKKFKRYQRGDNVSSEPVKIFKGHLLTYTYVCYNIYDVT